MRHDVTFPLYVEVDEIYNLACPASPIHYQRDPVQTTKTSVHGAINMLGLAKRVNAKILQASTSEVYGDPAVHPQTEEYWGNVNPIGSAPVTTRESGAPKRCFSTIGGNTHCRSKVARIFNTYGPRMHPNDGRVVSNFVIQALIGRGSENIRRWFANAFILLRGRLGRWAHSPDGDGGSGDRTDQSRQSRRIYDTGSRKDRHRNGWKVSPGLFMRPSRKTTRASANPTSQKLPKSWAGRRKPI